MPAMSRPSRRLIVAACFGAALTMPACSDRNDFTETPPKDSAAPGLARTSYIAVTPEVDLDALQTALDARVPAVLGTFSQPKEGCATIAGVRIDCIIEGSFDRDGPIRLDAADGAIRMAVPVRARAAVRGTGPIGRRLSDTVSIGLTATATGTPRVSEDWQMTLMVEPGISFSGSPSIRVFGSDIPLGFQFEEEIRRQIAGSGAAQLALRHDLREEMGATWNAIQAPWLLVERPRIWLRLQPQQVYLPGIRIVERQLRLPIAVEVRSSAYLRDEAPRIEPQPLAPLRAASPPRGENRFGVGIPLFVSLLDACANLSREFAARGAVRPIPNNAAQATIHAVTCYPSNGRIAFALDVTLDSPGRWLDSRGRVHVTAHPVFDPATNRIYASDYRVTARSDNRLSDLAIRLANAPLIRGRILRAMSYDAGPALTRARDEANRRLRDLSTPNVRVDAQVAAIRIVGVQLWNDQLVVVAEATGAVAVVPILPAP